MKNSLTNTMRKRVSFEAPVYTSDLLGGFITAWNNVATVWADVSPSGNSKLRAEKISAGNNYVVTARYLPSITTKMRINLSGRYFSINSIVNVGEKGEVMQITASDEVK